MRPPDPVNVLTQIKALTTALASNSPDDVKSYDLVWLIHLVSDAHQPLHATSRFTAADPGDNGGNAETVKPTNAAAESLHAFWDGLLGDRLTPDQAISMAASLPSTDPVRAARADPEVWCDESEAAAEALAYASPIRDGDGPYNLTADYQKKAIDVPTFKPLSRAQGWPRCSTRLLRDRNFGNRAAGAGAKRYGSPEQGDAKLADLLLAVADCPRRRERYDLENRKRVGT